MVVHTNFCSTDSSVTCSFNVSLSPSLFLSALDKPGRWSSGNDAVITMDSSTGVATAVSDGRAVVYHKVDGVVDTHTEASHG